MNISRAAGGSNLSHSLSPGGGSRLFLSPSEQQRSRGMRRLGRHKVWDLPGPALRPLPQRHARSRAPSARLILSTITPAPCPANQNLCKAPGFLLPRRGSRMPSSFDPFRPTALQRDIPPPPAHFKPCFKASLALLRQVPIAVNVPTGCSNTTRCRRSYSSIPQQLLLRPTAPHAATSSLPALAGGSPGAYGPAQTPRALRRFCRTTLGCVFCGTRLGCTVTSRF